MTSVTSQTESGSVDGLIQVDETQVRSHLDQLVRQSVEDTLNSLLQAEADALCGAKRYERSVERLDTRAGHCDARELMQGIALRLDVSESVGTSEQTTASRDGPSIAEDHRSRGNRSGRRGRSGLCRG